MEAPIFLLYNWMNQGEIGHCSNLHPGFLSLTGIFPDSYAMAGKYLGEQGLGALSANSDVAGLRGSVRL